MSDNKNRLSFNLYSDAETKLVNVVCVEGIGCLASFTPAYEKFEKAHSTTAHSLDKILSALNDVFIAGDVEKDLELVRVSMAMLETHPFMFYLEYLEDTVSPKLSHNKLNKPEVVDMHKLFPPMPMMGMKGDVPGMMFNQPDLDMFLGSKKPSKEEKKEEAKRTSLTFDDVVGIYLLYLQMIMGRI